MISHILYMAVHGLTNKHIVFLTHFEDVVFLSSDRCESKSYDIKKENKNFRHTKPDFNWFC